MNAICLISVVFVVPFVASAVGVYLIHLLLKVTAERSIKNSTSEFRERQKRYDHAEKMMVVEDEIEETLKKW